MTEGTLLLYQIVKNKDYKSLSKLNWNLLLPEEKEHFTWVKEFIEKYKDFPTINLFKKQIEFEVDEESLEPSQYYLDKILERFKSSLLLENVDIINKYLEEGKINKVIDQFNTIIEKIRKNELESNSNVLTYEELIELSLQQSIQNRVKETIGIPTGWNTLDEALGGFTKGNFYAVVARVKMGKSAILLKMSREASKQGYKTIFISLEMPAIEIADRLLGMEFHLNKTYITRGRLSSATELYIKEELEEKAEDFKNYYFIDGKFSTSIDEIRYVIQEIKPDIVFIDGAYLIRVNKRFNAKWELVTHTAEQLKYMAMDYQIPIVASYQFNRTISRKLDSVADKGFESVGLSDAISQLASAGIALLKPNESDKIRIIEVIGSRDGGESKFYINWDWERMNFEEVKDYAG